MHLPPRDEVRYRKARMRAQMDARWVCLKDYKTFLWKMLQVGPTNAIEAQLLRETLSLVIAELQFKEQETAELMLYDFDLETEGPEEPGRPTS